MAVNIDTTFLRRCIASLERAVEGIERQEDRDDVMYDIYRAACVKEFELVLEQSGKLLRKRLAPWFASNRQADRLHFKDLFRHAARHDLISTGAVERWLRYRDNRSFTAHDYGEDFAEATLKLLPTFIGDAEALADIIERPDDA
ncbi:MAG: nucleotidyltransferase [Gemmatimonadetes bacterium]|nr:nucleotidyltransferase [Gemmatimonadota bacterium]MYC91484.1 nucleotidyltransferase [Gemmatimonadota bacterium]MYJ16978.1 nucleotidyltransferase [Gemmatimonadota bacterium]